MTGGPLLRLGGDQLSLAEPVEALCFAPRKPLVAALGDQGTLRVWNTQTREVRSSRLVPGADRAGLLAFLFAEQEGPDEHLLVHDGGRLLRVPTAPAADPVPLTIAGMPETGIADAVAHWTGRTVLLHQEEAGRPAALWHVDVATGTAIPLDSWISARELEALGIRPQAQAEILFSGAAAGGDGSALALASYASRDGASVEWLYLRWTPSGERIVSARVNPEATAGLDRHVFPRRGFRLHPSGRWALHSWGRPLLVAIDTGEIVATYEAPPFAATEAVSAVDFAGGGRTLVAASESGMAMWEVDSGKLLASRRFEKRCFVRALAASQDRQDLAAVADDASVRLHSTKDLAPLHAASGHGNAVTAAAICPRGRRIASTDRGALRVWHLPSGEPVWTRFASIGLPLAFSPDGTRLACTLDGIFHVLDAATGDTVAKGDGGGGSFVWTEDGRLVHLDYVESEGRTLLRLFEGTERRLVYETPTAKLRCTPALSADGRRAIVHDEARAHGWDLPSRRRLWTRDISVRCVAVSPDGTHAAYTEAGIVDVLLLEMETGRFVYGILVRPYVETLAWSLRDEVAAGATDSITVLSTLPPTSGEARATVRTFENAHAAPVSAIAFSRDGSLLASGAKDGSVALWKP